MPRTTVPKILAPGAYSGALTAATFTALSGTTGANGNQFALDGTQFILFQNNSTVARTINLTSVDDDLGRKEDIQVSIPGSAFRIFGPVKIKGWQQTDGNFYFDANNVAVRAMVFTIPGL